jgi:hypothetical protein
VTPQFFVTAISQRSHTAATNTRHGLSNATRTTRHTIMKTSHLSLRRAALFLGVLHFA